MAVFNRIHPAGGSMSHDEAASGFGPVDAAPAERPYVGLNMVATVDGKATVDGRSGPIGNDADRELFHALRGQVDAVMAGAGTVRAERYGRIVRDPARREARAKRGLEPDPIAVVVSGRLDLPLDLPLLQEPEQRVVIVTASDAELGDCAAEVHFIRCDDESMVSLVSPLAQLRRDFGVGSLLCEGGPLLNSTLVAERLVDELWLAVAPKLAAGGGPTIVTGAALDPPVELALEWVLETGDDNLFFRYRLPRL